MDLFRSLGVAGWAWRSVLPLSIRPRIWIPFILVAASQAIALGLLTSFHQPLVLPLALPIVKVTGGEAATHYPFLYYFLPSMFHRVNLVLAVILSSLAGGVATILFARGFAGEPLTGAWGSALRRYWPLLLVTAILAALIYGAAMLSGQVPRDLILTNAKVRWGVRGATLALIILIQSLFAYTTAWIVLRGHRTVSAIRDSFRVTARTLLPTLVVVAVPILLLFPLDYLLGRVDLFAGKLSPETLGSILYVRIAVELLVSFFLLGALTRLFLWRQETAG